MFPEECNICNKTCIKSKGKVETPDKIATFLAERTVKESAKQKDPDFNSKIAYVDVIAKEFRYHRTCYRNFTQDYLSNSATSFKSQEEDSHEASKGDFEKAKRFISENILGGNEAISMSSLQGIYGIRANDSQYRSKLKKKIGLHLKINYIL